MAWLGLTVAGKELIGTTMRRRRTEIARLVDRIDVPDPGAVSSVLTALAEAAGETPDPQWWDHWAESVLPDAD